MNDKETIKVLNCCVGCKYELKNFNEVPCAECTYLKNDNRKGENMTEYKSPLTEKEILQEAIHRYGAINQLYVAIEELSELTKELTKVLRGFNYGDEIDEEMADVYIVLEELKMIFLNEDFIEEWRDKKIARLEERLWKKSNCSEKPNN